MPLKVIINKEPQPMNTPQYSRIKILATTIILSGTSLHKQASADPQAPPPPNNQEASAQTHSTHFRNMGRTLHTRSTIEAFMLRSMCSSGICWAGLSGNEAGNTQPSGRPIWSFWGFGADVAILHGTFSHIGFLGEDGPLQKIGRASCRERV